MLQYEVSFSVFDSDGIPQPRTLRFTAPNLTAAIAKAKQLIAQAKGDPHGAEITELASGKGVELK